MNEQSTLNEATKTQLFRSQGTTIDPYQRFECGRYATWPLPANIYAPSAGCQTSVTALPQICMHAHWVASGNGNQCTRTKSLGGTERHGRRIYAISEMHCSPGLTFRI